MLAQLPQHLLDLVYDLAVLATYVGIQRSVLNIAERFLRRGQKTRGGSRE
jgi:hypothetical protein